MVVGVGRQWHRDTGRQLHDRARGRGRAVSIFQLLREALTHFDRAVQAGLQSGDFHYAAFAACQSVAGRICMGDEVRGCLEPTEQMYELRRFVEDALAASTGRAHSMRAALDGSGGAPRPGRHAG